MKSCALILLTLAVGCDEGASPAALDAALPDACSGSCLPPRPPVQTCGPDPVHFDALPALVARPALTEIVVPTAVAVRHAARVGVWFVARADGRVDRMSTGPGAGRPHPVLTLRRSRLLDFVPAPDFDDAGALYVLTRRDDRPVVLRFTVPPGYPEADPATETTLWAGPMGAESDRLWFGRDGRLLVSHGPSDAEPGGVLRLEEDGEATLQVTGLTAPTDCTSDPDGPEIWCLDRRDGLEVLLRLDPGEDAGEAIPALSWAPVPGCTAVGGRVYRGFQWPELWGAYLFAPGCDGAITAVGPDGAGRRAAVVATLDSPIRAFTKDTEGRVLARDAAGHLARLEVADPDTRLGWPDRLSQTGCFDQLDPVVPGPDLLPYALNAALWTDGAVKRRWMVVPPRTRILTRPTGEWSLPMGSVLIKQFALPTAGGVVRPVETRMMVRQPFGWSFHTYRWNPEGTDAMLLSGLEPEYGDFEVATDAGLTDLRYLYPSRQHCQTCHNRRVESVLGPRTAQLDRHLPDGTSQLDALHALGVLDQRPRAPAMPDPADLEAPLAERARAYLHTNCAHCHQPGGWTPPNLGLDLRYATPLAETGACGITTRYRSFGIPGALRISPGDRHDSSVYERMQATGFGRMPLLGTSLVDPMVDRVVGVWIDSLDGCR